ncbi:hypothetical protein TNCV_3891961 [Trichonephila clavipes]|nr:hypothetical protein TNCV_3891961 [Trichonephila clavipes]
MHGVTASSATSRKRHLAKNVTSTTFPPSSGMQLFHKIKESIQFQNEGATVLVVSITDLIRREGQSPPLPSKFQDRRNDRTHPAPGRCGTAILIKNCIPHYHVPTPLQFTGVEATLIMLTPKDHEPILIGSTYIPPVNEYSRNLGAALDTIFNFNMTILVGDFNAKHTSWGCPVSDTRGNRLHRYVVNNGIDVLAPPTPTKFGTASATIIDYALMKNLIWPCTIDSIAELSSDHNPIKLNFQRTPKFEIPPPQLNTNWNVFTTTLANNKNLYLPQASSTPEIESQVRSHK